MCDSLFRNRHAANASIHKNYITQLQQHLSTPETDAMTEPINLSMSAYRVAQLCSSNQVVPVDGKGA